MVTVYDGEDTDSNVIAQYCGFHNSEEIISFTNQMLVVFTSDSRLEEQGFAASYEFIGKTSAATHPRNVNDSTKREALAQHPCTSTVKPLTATPQALSNKHTRRHFPKVTLRKTDYPKITLVDSNCDYDNDTATNNIKNKQHGNIVEHLPFTVNYLTQSKKRKTVKKRLQNTRC